MQIRSGDFETIENVDEKNKKNLLKSVVDPLDRQYVNNGINPSDYTRDDNNNAMHTKIDPSVLHVMNFIINNSNKINDEVTVTDTKTDPEPVTVQETPITLKEILTGQNNVEDICIDDEGVLQETYKTIFTGDPALPAPPEPEVDDNVTYKTIFFGMPALKAPPPPPPLPLLSNSTVAMKNTILPTIETELPSVEVDNIIPIDLNERLSNLFSTSPMETDLNLPALTYSGEVLTPMEIDPNLPAVTYNEVSALSYNEVPALT